MTDFTKRAGFNLIRRHRAEQRFQWAGRTAILISLAFLVLMFGTILRNGSGVLRLTQIAVTVDLSPEMVDPADPGLATVVARAAYSPFRRATRSCMKACPASNCATVMYSSG